MEVFDRYNGYLIMIGDWPERWQVKSDKNEPSLFRGSYSECIDFIDELTN